MVSVHVSSLTDAVVECRALAASGRFNLFRGQTRHWPRLLPSLFRRSGDDRRMAKLQLSEFVDWAEQVPQMAPYHGDVSAITAIGQHYGVPTRLLDLTTDPEVAARFSKRPSTDDGKAEGVIYAFDERDLIVQDGVRVLRIDVSNLWRLERQHGLFLEVLDERAMRAVLGRAIRIHFPVEVLTDADSESLYPTRKSALESVIDQWFYRRDVADVFKTMEPIPNKMAIRRHTYPGMFRWRVVPEL